MKTALLAIGVLAGLLSGCTITQKVNPVAFTGSKDICIIENPAVRATFLQAYAEALQQRGYTTKTLAPSSPITACPVTSTYTANWRWDMAMYMAYAKIVVYHNGTKAGDAVYDATKGGGNMNKFIHAKDKIDELVAKLFPGQ